VVYSGPRGCAASVVSPEAWMALGRADLEPTTLWDFPDQGSSRVRFGDPSFNGVTPADAAANLVRRYSNVGDLVVDPMAGSGTVEDVARSLGRRVASFDLVPRRREVARADARALPLQDHVATLVIVDSPYSNNIEYSREPGCLGRLSCQDERFYIEMGRVAREASRVLVPSGVLAWIVSDEYRGGLYTPVGFRLFHLLLASFRAVDTCVLARHHDRSGSPLWEHRARRFNFFLRGFKFLLIMRKRSFGRRDGHAERSGSDE